MAAHISRDEIIKIVSIEVAWMTGQRMAKLRSEIHDSMSVNPFLIPILYDLHHAENFGELGELLLAGHLMTGHSTSFGKLIDERVLPKLFDAVGTKKLDAKYRAGNTPFIESCFDTIDLLVLRPNKLPALLSLKSSRWTLQLAGAKALNTGFSQIRTKHRDKFSEIVLGVLYGKSTKLGDKYDISVGINRGKNHDVENVTDYVRVLAGGDLWAWVNGDEPATQAWIMDGIIEGLRQKDCRKECRELLEGYKKAFNSKYDKHIDSDGKVNWHAILADINS